MVDSENGESGWPPRKSYDIKIDAQAAAPVPSLVEESKDSISWKSVDEFINDGKTLDDKGFIPWEGAVIAMSEYLATSHFKSKVLEVGPEVFGRSQERAEAHVTGFGSATGTKETVYVFTGVKFKVEKASGKVMDMVLAFRFNWTGDQWRIIEAPGVMC